MANHSSPQSMESSLAIQRLNTIDIAKGIGIIFVVFAHINYTPWLLTLIYSFHMPLFFIISGMLFKKERYPDFLTFLKRKSKTLILPYLFFCLLAIVYVYLSEHMFPTLFGISKEEYIRYFTQIFIAQGSAPMLNTPLWFVPCLFLVEMLFYFISGMQKSQIIAICSLLATFGWVLESGKLSFDNTLLPWSLDSALFALSFYASGNLFFDTITKSIEKIKMHHHKTWLCIGIILTCIAFWLPLTLLNGKVSLGSKVLNNGFLFYLTGILGSLGIFAVSILLENCKFLRFCGKNTFCIMSVHYMIRKFTIPKLYYLADIPLYNRKSLSETILPFVIVLIMSLFFTLLYNKVTASIHPKPAQ